MRVIGGSLKGKKLLIPLDKSTRPLRDMVRESIFNILDHSSKVSKNINNSKVLDLFSGTGSFGIECLSRGAKEVIFFENYSNSIKVLKNNIFNLKLESKTKVYANGGRVLNFVSISDNLKSSRDQVIREIENLNWDKGFYRRDIGYKIIDK